jgi:hypothetical protein
MWWRILLGIWLATLSGCYSTVDRIATRQVARGPVIEKDLDTFLRETFTDEAYEAIKDIEVLDGPARFGYAKGTTKLSSVWGVLCGAGFGNKVILDFDDFPVKDNLDLTAGEALVHEMVHHLHVMTLNGEADFIDESEFEPAYINCYNNSIYMGITLYVENRANLAFTRVFGIGEIAEHIAYTAEVIAFQGCPEDLGYVYRKILRKYERNSTKR